MLNECVQREKGPGTREFFGIAQAKCRLQAIRCVRDRYPQLLPIARSEHATFVPLGDGQVAPEAFLRGLHDEKLLDLFGQEYEQENCQMT